MGTEVRGVVSLDTMLRCNPRRPNSGQASTMLRAGFGQLRTPLWILVPAPARRSPPRPSAPGRWAAGMESPHGDGAWKTLTRGPCGLSRRGSSRHSGDRLAMMSMSAGVIPAALWKCRPGLNISASRCSPLSLLGAGWGEGDFVAPPGANRHLSPSTNITGTLVATSEIA